MEDFYKDSIDKLEELLAESNLPWWEWNVQKNITRTNGLKEKILGYDPEDFQGVGYEAYTNQYILKIINGPCKRCGIV